MKSDSSKIFSSNVAFLIQLILLLIILVLPNSLSAQYFSVGQDPGNLKWRQIQSEHFQIIFPSDYESEANRVAHIFEKVYNYSGVTLQHKPKRISIIIHSKSNESNGFVAWSPSRIELFPTPHQEIYSQDWIEQLAIHELRHHVQIDKIESELPTILRILLGEQAASIVIGAYLPFWYLEGDAVVNETALSKTGRGRLSSFSMELKAQVDNKGIYSFDKAYLGSYKDYVPDYYKLGYQIVSNIRIQHGGEVWGEVLHYIARHPLGLNSLAKGLKLATGKNQDAHYKLVMNNLKSNHPFELGISLDSANVSKQILKKEDCYINYSYPFYLNDTTYIALKTSLDRIPEIIIIDNKQNEKRVFQPGSILDESMSVTDQKIIWLESVPDIRWTYDQKTLLRVLDIEKNVLTERIFKEKLFAPVVSPDGKSIAAIKYNDHNKCSILLINSENFETIKEFKAPSYQNYLTPTWSEKSDVIYAVELDKQGKSLIQLNIDDGIIEYLTTPTMGEIKKPQKKGNYLFYCGNQYGKLEGYILDLISRKKYRIASSKYGIRDLQCSPNGRSLLFAEYTANGFKMVLNELIPPTEALNDSIASYCDPMADKLTAQENGAIDFANLDTSKYESKKYVKLRNLFNIHSWSPVFIDPDRSVINAGFSVASQNKLSTAITQIGYDYNTTNQSGKWVGKFEYLGYFPILRFYCDYGREKSTYYQINKHFSMANGLAGQDTVAVNFTQKVLNTHFDVAIPLNLSRGKMYRMIEPEFQIGYSYKWQNNSTPTSIFRGSYIPFTYRLYAHNLTKTAPRDIQSKWGQIFDIQYRHTLLGDRQLGSIAAAEGTFLFPGLFRNQGIKIYFGYQEKKTSKNYFNDLVYYARGYNNLENNRLSTFRSDYVFPLLSPDWNIWRLYYLKRVTLRIHYDVSWITSPVQNTSTFIDKNLISAGGEIMTECYFLRFIAPVKIGWRESLLMNTRQLASEFIFSINFSGI